MDEVDLALEQAQTRRRLPPPAARRRLRERAGLRQGVLARVLGVSGAAVSRWESGKRMPARRFVSAYASLLDRLARESANGGGA